MPTYNSAEYTAIIMESLAQVASGIKAQDTTRMRDLLARLPDGANIPEKVLEAAAKNNWEGTPMTKLLLEQPGADVVITEAVVKAAAGNEWSGVAVMKLLLEQGGAGVVITEGVVKAAAGNEKSGEEIIKLLCEQRGADVVVTEEVGKAAAKNENSGEQVMIALLEHRGADVVVTEEVIKVVVANKRSGAAVIKLLLEKRGADIKVTEDVVKAAAENSWSGEAIIKLLLKQQRADVKITEEVVKIIASQFGQEVMEVLLEQQRENVVITEAVIKAVVESSWGRWSKEAIIKLLLKQQRADVKITEEVVKIIAGQFGQEVMEALLEQQGGNIVITKEVVKAAAGNAESGEAVIKLLLKVLLKQQGGNVVITEEVVKAAAENNRSGEAVMKLLLEMADVKITEEVVKAAAGNEKSGKAVILLLLEESKLEERGSDIEITDGIAEAIKGRIDQDVIKLLQREVDRSKALSSSFDRLSDTDSPPLAELKTEGIIELDHHGGFRVSWGCRCGRRFEALIAGPERRAAEEFLQRMNWNVKRDGPMVTHCFNFRWLEDFLWALSPNLLGRFSFELSRNGIEAGDLEVGRDPSLMEPDPTNRESQGIGMQKGRRLSSNDAQDELLYICLVKRKGNQWRLKHAKVDRSFDVKSPEMQGEDGIFSRNMDKLLFFALREKLIRSSKGTGWFNPLVITELEFWEFKLFHAAKLVERVERDKLPYESQSTDPESPDAKPAAGQLEGWQYTYLTGQKLSEYKGNLRSEYLLHLLKFPEDAHPESPIWTGLPRKIRTKLINHQSTPKTGWGFSVEHEWNSVAFTILMCPIIIVGFIVAIYMSVRDKWPASAGITMALAPVSLVAFVNTMLGGIMKQKGLSK